MYANKNNDDKLINTAIKLAEDEITARAKNDITNECRVTTGAAHTATDKTKTTIHQRGKNVGNTIPRPTIATF